MPHTTHLGNIIKSLRQAKYPELSAKEFGELAGLKPNYLSKLESGQIVVPSADNFERIAEKLEARCEFGPFLRRYYLAVSEFELFRDPCDWLVAELWTSLDGVSPTFAYMTDFTHRTKTDEGSLIGTTVLYNEHYMQLSNGASYDAMSRVARKCQAWIEFSCRYMDHLFPCTGLYIYDRYFAVYRAYDRFILKTDKHELSNLLEICNEIVRLKRQPMKLEDLNSTLNGIFKKGAYCYSKEAVSGG